MTCFFYIIFYPYLTHCFKILDFVNFGGFCRNKKTSVMVVGDRSNPFLLFQYLHFLSVTSKTVVCRAADPDRYSLKIRILDTNMILI